MTFSYFNTQNKTFLKENRNHFEIIIASRNDFSFLFILIYIPPYLKTKNIST